MSYKSTNRIFIFMIPTVISWAGAFIAGKISVQEIPPFTLNLYRFLVASMALLPLLLIFEKGNWSIKNKRDWLYIFALGFIFIFLYHIIFFIALQYTQAVNASLIIATSPMVGSILAALITKEDLNFVRVIAIIIAFFGVLLTISQGNLEIFTNLEFNFGDIILILAVFCFAFYSVLSKKATANNSTLIVLFYSFIVGMIFLIPFVIYEAQDFNLLNVGWEAHVGAIYMGLFSSALGYFLLQLSIREFGAGKSMSFVNLVPVFAITLSAIFLNENITHITLLSALIIISGLFLNTNSDKVIKLLTQVFSKVKKQNVSVDPELTGRKR